MARPLTLVAITGFAVCIACLGTAAAIAGHDWQGSLSGLHLGLRPNCDFDSVSAAGGRQRVFDWDGGDAVSISVPGTAHYQPNSGDNKLRATGDPRILAHLRVDNGHVELDCNQGFGAPRPALDITLPGRTFRDFAVAGSNHLTLAGIDQTDLNLTIAGSGAVEASGKVEALRLAVAGSGQVRLGDLAARRVRGTVTGSGIAVVAPGEDADMTITGSGAVEGRGKIATLQLSVTGSGDARLGDLVVRRARVEVRGSGTATIAPEENADIGISGSGIVRLAHEPHSINSHIRGSGRIDHLVGE